MFTEFLASAMVLGKGNFLEGCNHFIR